MIDILFIAIEFAPVNRTGTFRSLKFVKYLREFGINPVVITIDVESASNKGEFIVDNSLMDEIPPEVKIIRVPGKPSTREQSSALRIFLSIYFSIKDSYAKRWRSNLLKTMDSIIKQYSPKAIFTTLPPHSMGKLAVEIAEKYNLPLILDMRDGWAKWCVSPFGSRIHYLLALSEEKYIFKKAAAITTVTKQLSDVFKETHPDIVQSKFHVVPNGFDIDVDFKSQILAKVNANNEFHIGYIGSFYYTPKQRKAIFTPWYKRKFHRALQYVPVKEDWLYRSPFFFFKALKVLIDSEPGYSKVIKIKFIGSCPQWLKEMAKEFNIEENCIFYGKLSYSQVLKQCENIDAFLATSAKVIGGEDYALPSKTFDYITQQKPILGFVTRGAQKEFLENSGLGIICDPDDHNESSQKIKDLVNGRVSLIPDKNYLESFKRKNLALKLATLIKTL